MENTIRCLTERAIVRALIAEVGRAGFVPQFVDDGGDQLIPVTTPDAMLDAAFAVDESRVYFRNASDPDDKSRYWVFLVGGNGTDILSDWGTRNASFNHAVDCVAMNVKDLLTVALKAFEPCTVAGPEGERCTRPAGHAYAPKAYHEENHEAGSPNYQRW